jgi:phospholipid/cholesterol/gamma-HCH transport system substrate-binding protein
MSEASAPPIEQPVALQRSTRQRVVRVALLLALSLAILGGLVTATGPLAVVGGKTVRADFGFAGPIKPGAAVRIAGVIVGAVRGVELLAGTDLEAGPKKMVRVTAKLEARAMAALTDRARFRVTTLGVLGEHYLDVEPVAGGTPLVDGVRIDGVDQPRPDLLLSRASGLLERAEELLPSSPEARDLMKSMTALLARLDAALGGDDAAGALGHDESVPALVQDLRALIHAAAVGLGDGSSLRRSLDKMPEVLERTDALAASLDEAGLGPLVVDARASLVRLDRTLELVANAPLMDASKQEALRTDVASAMRSIDAFSRRADRLLSVVEQKKGGAGKLFWDEAAADDLQALLRGLRRDPVRFMLGGKNP